MEPHAHPELRKEIERIRDEGRQNLINACSDIKDLSVKIDAQVDRWGTWSDSQFGKFDEFRQDISRMTEAVKGAVEQKIEIDAHLMGTVQRIEKQFDQFARARDADLKELYTMAAKAEQHERDIREAHNKTRALDQKVDKLITDLPGLVKLAVQEAMKEQESRALVGTAKWIGGIVTAVIATGIAEFIVFKLLGTK